VGEGTRVHGDVTTRGGDVTLAPGAQVLGEVSCSDLELHAEAEVDGAIRSRGEMRIQRPGPGRVPE
ncbi:MAG: acyltransferase, partial [Haloferacaceae archaeon]